MSELTLENVTNKIKIVLGPPGTGKTWKAITLVEQALQAGISPSRIAFLSFTKFAANEAKVRAMEKFNLTSDQLPWFRTIHSLAYLRMEYKRDRVVGRVHLNELANRLGIEIKGTAPSEDNFSTLGTGDRLLSLDNMARVTRKGLTWAWEQDDHNVNREELGGFSQAYRDYKAENFLVDFTDMLEQFCLAGVAPSLDLLVVDEFQDCSSLQMDAILALAKNAKQIYLLGDDDQAIHCWAGADVERFLGFIREVGTSNVEVLEQSNRISQAAHSLATTVIEQIHNRQPKVFHPFQKNTGNVVFTQHYSELDLTDKGKGNWLLLARNQYMLNSLEQVCLEQGVSFDSRGSTLRTSKLLRAVMLWEKLRKGARAPLDEVIELAKLLGKSMSRGVGSLQLLDSGTILSIADLKADHGLTSEAIWHQAMLNFPRGDREYFFSLHERGEKLLQEPRVKISTIHGAKGGEAQNVAIMQDISYSAWKSLQRNPDDETRVFYVGLTRSLGDMTVITPQTNLFFEL